MPEKDPTSYSLLTYAWVTLLAAWGGAVSFLAKVRSGAVRPCNLVEFVGEITTSAFSGLLTFWGCEAAGFEPLWTAVLVGISGHMGARALYQMELIAQRKQGFPANGEDR
jgi:hypothetical protein